MNRTFFVPDNLADDMRRFRHVDWDAVVESAIRTKVKLMRQVGRTENRKSISATSPAAPRMPPESSLPVAVVKGPRTADPSPEEILRRAAEVRAAR